MTPPPEAWAAAVCAGCAAWVLCGGGGPAVAGVGRPQLWARLPRPVRPRRARFREMAIPPEGLCLPVAVLAALWGRSWLPLALAALLAWPLARRARRRAGERAARARREEVIAFCVALAGEVRAGRHPEEALLAAGVSGLGPAASGVPAAARYGGDVPGALRRAAGQPGAAGLSGVAACWRVAVDGGASLAAGLDRVAAALRAERDRRDEVRAALAGPRATALTLAALPAAGILLGAAMGVRPLDVLLHTPAGLGCLAAGGALECAGIAWAAALTRRAAGAAP